MSITYNLFFSESECKNLLPISTNIDITQLRTIMLQVQIQYATPLVCQALYDEIYIQIATNTVTLLNQALLDQIKPMLSWYTLYEFYPFCWSKMREQSVVKQNTPYGDPVGLKDLTYLRGNAKDFADRLSLEFQKWINFNKASYPLYSDCCNSCKCNPCSCNDFMKTTWDFIIS